MSAAMTEDDVRVVKLVVSTVLLHAVLPAMIVKTMSDEAMSANIDRVLALSDRLVSRSGIEARVGSAP